MKSNIIILSQLTASPQDYQRAHFSLFKIYSFKREKHTGFSSTECTFAARQDFSNLYSGFHFHYTIHLLPTMKITTWFDETFVCRVKSLQFKNLQMYTYSCLPTKHTSAQERAKKGYNAEVNAKGGMQLLQET